MTGRPTRDLKVEFQMVLQVLPDTWPVGEDGNAERLQFGARPDAGQLQQLWRIDRATGQNDLAPSRRRNARGCRAGSAYRRRGGPRS